jgi:flagellar protein FliS
MWNNGHDAYLESRVMTADPVELISLLYQACTQSVRDARGHLAGGRIAERAREITRACAIVSELAVVLDHERGGEISRRLALLYDYIQRRLVIANLEQSDEPLAEVLGLLVTLSEGWAGVRPPETIGAPEPPIPALPAEAAWSQPMAQESGYGMQSWSL